MPFDSQTTQSIGNGLRYAISSHVHYKDVALPVLLRSLTQVNGIDPERILVTVGGAEVRRAEIVNGVEYRYVDHNSLDLTALIEILEGDPQGDHWCLLHDTTEAGSRFASVMESFSPDWEHVAIDSVGWTNMGIYRKDFLESHRNFLMRCRNLDKIRAMMTEKMFLRMGHTTTVEQGSYQVQGERLVYGPDSASRRIVYFPTADLHKYMANYATIRVKRSVILRP